MAVRLAGDDEWLTGTPLLGRLQKDTSIIQTACTPAPPMVWYALKNMKCWPGLDLCRKMVTFFESRIEGPAWC